jgi:UDP-N-acetylglucosamine:LPS N-acetylglucosamine transferase
MTGGRVKRVMILYASYGDGHYQVARTLRDELKGRGIHDIAMIDLFKEASPTVNAIARYFYIKSYNVMPAVYGWLYYGTKHIRWDSFFAKWLQAYGIQKLMELMKEQRPDMVIHTFPMSVMPEISRKTGHYIPSVTVVTDFDLHRRWVHPAIDRFYVATDDLKAKIDRAGIPESRIVVSGIPVQPAFEQPLSAKSIREKYGLPDQGHNVLIMAGSYGVMQGLGDMCERLVRHRQARIIVVCGKNKVLQSEMERRFASMPNVRVMGFVEHIHELMHIAACIVTKPGGITLSEAIMKQLPILIYRPVPGQERDNALYLSGRGAARIAYEPQQLEAQILELLQDEGRLRDMRRALAALRKPHAARVIVDDILSLERNVHQLNVHKA